MISLHLLRELSLREPTAPGRLAQVSAASGLVAAGEHLYVVIDDENHLAVFPRSGDAAGELIRLLPGVLPTKHRERKAAKADFEALLRLPAFAGCDAGALLALGSGSRPNRSQGVLLALDGDGGTRGEARIVDLAPLYASLCATLPGLNIEGAVCVGKSLWLFQRGNAAGASDARIVLDLEAVLDRIAQERPLDAGVLTGVTPVDLGKIDGIALGFTDACALPDGRIVFCAVAENTKSAYEDGPCAGSVIGLLDVDGRLLRIERTTTGDKVEGISAHIEGDLIRLLLVTDDDDEKIPARLLAAEFRA